MQTRSDWHYTEWDPEKIRRLWKFSAEYEPWQQRFFSKQVGSGLATFLSKADSLQGRILDLGCGPGHLLECLLAQGIPCGGVDSSADLAAFVQGRLGKHPLWRGVKTSTNGILPYGDGEIDMVICVETIEHVIVAQRDSFLAEIRRILRTDTGKLFLTCPNQEDIQVKMAFCPECGAVFHPWGHLASFSPQSMTALMEKNGFKTILCSSTDFALFQDQTSNNLLDWTPRRLARLVKDTARNVLGRNKTKRDYAFQRKIGSGPHLFWLGTRS
jgi:2-polyprenyl-3-methyl-5-hydroxy-6-metoxy-1,4-benzoquinol methylase